MQLRNILNISLNDLIDRHAPLQEIFYDSKNNPWWNKTCQKAHKYRRRNKRSFRKIRSADNKLKFNLACIRAKTTYSQVREMYYTERLQNYQGDFRNTYRIVNQLLDKEFSRRSEGDPLSSDARSSEFADFFDNKIKAIYGNMQAHHSPNFDNTRNKSGYNCSLLNQQALQEFQPLTSLIVQTIIENMPSKVCHLDSLPTKLLKECIDELLPAILHIVNLSLLNGNFPDELKVACVTPILKRDSLDKGDVTNFRPVSNLPFLSKVNWKMRQTCNLF